MLPRVVRDAEMIHPLPTPTSPLPGTPAIGGLGEEMDEPSDPSSLRLVPLPAPAKPFSPPLLEHRLDVPLTSADLDAVAIVERARPTPQRAFDQIPMRSHDLLRQVKLVSPLLAGKTVAFVGDLDGAATLLGLLTRRSGSAPARIGILDFDDRVLVAVEGVARRHGFENLLETRRYNVFDPVPRDLVGEWDYFYVNPPYGSRNDGESARLFIARGCELVRSTGGSGCVILPDDPQRPWTRRAMLATQRFLTAHGWVVREKLDQLHRYQLDDDPDLPSSLVLVDRVACEEGAPLRMPYSGRPVDPGEIPSFYGRGVMPPFPRYIDCDAAPDFDWPAPSREERP